MSIGEDLRIREVITVYMDTNIIMGLVRRNFSKKIVKEMTKILKLRKEGRIKIYLSEIVESELNGIPEKYIYYHRLIYDLIDNVATKPEHFYWISTGPSPYMGGSPLTPIGLAQRIEDRLFSRLKNIIPEKKNPKKNQSRLRDIKHLYQCKKNNIDLFWTEDTKTIIRYTSKLEDLGIYAVNTSNLLSLLEDNEIE